MLSIQKPITQFYYINVDNDVSIKTKEENLAASSSAIVEEHSSDDEDTDPGSDWSEKPIPEELKDKLSRYV